MKTVKQLTFGDTILDGVQEDLYCNFSFRDLAKFTSYDMGQNNPNSYNSIDFGCGYISIVADNGSNDSNKRVMDMAFNKLSDDEMFNLHIIGSGANIGDYDLANMHICSEYDPINNENKWTFAVDADVVRLMPTNTCGYVSIGTEFEGIGETLYPITVDKDRITLNKPFYVSSGCIGGDGTYKIEMSSDTDSNGYPIWVLKND